MRPIGKFTMTSSTVSFKSAKFLEDLCSLWLVPPRCTRVHGVSIIYILPFHAGAYGVHDTEYASCKINTDHHSASIRSSAVP
jgi:hypothetical protein